MNIQTLEPFSRRNNVAVLYQVSEMYAPYCCVSIASIIQHATPEHYYDIVILCHDMTEVTKNRLLRYVERKKAQVSAHVSLRFYDVNNVVEPWRSKLPNSEHFPDEKYPKILMCSYWFVDQIFPEYEKVIRIGADTLLMEDIAGIYNEDIGENWIGAVRDTGNRYVLSNKEKAEYYKRKMGFDFDEMLKCYINADMQVINIPQWKKHQLRETLLQTGNRTDDEPWSAVEQDVVNFVCRGHIHYFGYRWNCFPYYAPVMKVMEPDDTQEWHEAQSAPALIHFAPEKPWHNQSAQFADSWWEYARETPFYELMLRRLYAYQDVIRQKLDSLRFRIRKEKFLMCILPGKKKRQKKIQQLQERLQDWNFILK